MEFMNPGHELDKKVAIEAMGDLWVGEVVWEKRVDSLICIGPGLFEPSGGCPHIAKVLPPYSTDMAAAWLIVEKIRDQTFSVRANFLKLIQELVSLRLFNKVIPEGTQVGWPDVMVYTTPKDLCHAGIRAMELKKEIFEKHFGKAK